MKYKRAVHVNPLKTQTTSVIESTGVPVALTTAVCLLVIILGKNTFPKLFFMRSMYNNVRIILQPFANKSIYWSVRTFLGRQSVGWQSEMQVLRRDKTLRQYACYLRPTFVANRRGSQRVLSPIRQWDRPFIRDVSCNLRQSSMLPTANRRHRRCVRTVDSNPQWLDNPSVWYRRTDAVCFGDIAHSFHLFSFILGRSMRSIYQKTERDTQYRKIHF